MRFSFGSLLKSRRRKAGTAGAGVTIIAAIAAFVGPWEGHENQAYLDRIASPPVWTICSGETRGVKAGDYATDAECAKMLERGVADFHRGLARCIPGLPEMPEGAQVAFVSWAYNVGLGAACKSTLARLANAGDIKGACNQLPRWNRAGGRVVRGLSNRRADERRICLRSLE